MHADYKIARNERVIYKLFCSFHIGLKKVLWSFLKEKANEQESKSTTDILQTKSKNMEWKTAIKSQSKRVFYSNCHLLLTTRKRWWRTSHATASGFSETATI